MPVALLRAFLRMKTGTALVRSPTMSAGASRSENAPSRPVLGWREWTALPELGVSRIKVKVDTGARSSALHAFAIRREEVNGETWLRFKIHPIQKDSRSTVEARARMVDERSVRSSSGQQSSRPVVVSPVLIGSDRWPIEITLVRRDLMGFRMLLGRQAVRGRYLVDPGRSFLRGEPDPEQLHRAPEAPA
ncbi:MAG: RimK/LysX family protein [Thermoanaerobaculia bacterium]|nr:RimK/LysX family protein [Thermoanaerobaculia bacterium]